MSTEKLIPQRALGCEFYLLRDGENKHMSKPALAALGARVDIMVSFAADLETQDRYARRALERGWVSVFRCRPDADVKGVHGFYKKIEPASRRAAPPEIPA
jgi:hypothetical protein